MWVWSNEHGVLVSIKVDCVVTLDKSLLLFARKLIYKMSSSQICSEDLLLNAYKLLWIYK